MNAKVWPAMLAVYIAWGSTYLAIRFAVETIPPFIMAGTRFLIAGVILYGWQRLAGTPAPRRMEWRSAAIVALLLLLGGNGGVTWAEQMVPSGVAALVVATAPLWMVVIDALLPGSRRPEAITIFGVLLGFAGILVLIWPTLTQAGAEALPPTGVAMLLFAAFAWALGSLYSRKAALPESAMLGTGMEMLAGAAGFYLLGALTGEWGQIELAGISARSAWGLVYLVTGGSLVGFVAYTWLLRNAPTPLVSTYAYVNPLVAVLLGSLLGQETLTWRILAAAAVIVSAVLIINRKHWPWRKPLVRRQA